MAMQSMKRQTVVGVFTDHQQAELAVSELRTAGFRENQIGVAGRDWRREGVEAEELPDTYAGEGAAAGAAAGAGAGVLWGLGILSGVMPAIGPAIAGGTLAILLSSAAAGAAAAGLAGTLIGLGIPKEDAEYYESEFHSGRIIVSVDAEGRANEAREILQRHGAYDRTTQPQLAGHRAV